MSHDDHQYAKRPREPQISDPEVLTLSSTPDIETCAAVIEKQPGYEDTRANLEVAPAPARV